MYLQVATPLYGGDWRQVSTFLLAEQISTNDGHGDGSTLAKAVGSASFRELQRMQATYATGAAQRRSSNDNRRTRRRWSRSSSVGRQIEPLDGRRSSLSKELGRMLTRNTTRSRHSTYDAGIEPTNGDANGDANSATLPEIPPDLTSFAASSAPNLPVSNERRLRRPAALEAIVGESAEDVDKDAVADVAARIGASEDRFRQERAVARPPRVGSIRRGNSFLLRRTQSIPTPRAGACAEAGYNLWGDAALPVTKRAASDKPSKPTELTDLWSDLDAPAAAPPSVTRALSSGKAPRYLVAKSPTGQLSEPSVGRSATEQCSDVASEGSPMAPARDLLAASTRTSNHGILVGAASAASAASAVRQPDGNRGILPTRQLSAEGTTLRAQQRWAKQAEDAIDVEVSLRDDENDKDGAPEAIVRAPSPALVPSRLEQESAASTSSRLSRVGQRFSASDLGRELSAADNLLDTAPGGSID